MRPSPSKSPAATLFHQPVRSLKVEGFAFRVSGDDASNVMVGFQGVSLPLSLRKIFSGPHSQAKTSSGKPSPLRSVNVAPLTSPMSLSALLLVSSGFNVPPSLRSNIEEAGSG